MTARVLADPLIASRSPAYGFNAGEHPEGIVTHDNVPGRAHVDLLVRSDHGWARRTISAADGTYRFSALPLEEEYDVIGRDLSGIYADVIVSRVRPYAPPRISNTS